jgi:hypothetical protein
MMTRVARLGIAASMILAMSLPALAAKALSPDDIKAQFGTGTPFNGVAVPGGRKYSLTLNADGTAQMTLLNDKSSKTGTWQVSKTGYCIKWGDKAQHCYKIQQNGSRYDVLDASGKVIAHWTKA